MPRTARVIVPYTPHHIIQRGHNRSVVFAHVADYEFYLVSLRELKVEFEVDVFAYCLMTNHIHLVLQVGDDVSAIGQLMKRLAARQTRYVNKLEGRTGTLWDSRFRSSPIDTDRYLLACCRYVELNPVRAGMVSPSTSTIDSRVFRKPIRPTSFSGHPHCVKPWRPLRRCDAKPRKVSRGSALTCFALAMANHTQPTASDRYGNER